MSSPRKKNSYCSYCGEPFADGTAWPRACAPCGSVSYLNPLPVGVTLVPIDGGGLLVIRRTIEPAKGKLALPGGFLEVGETWQEGCAREVREETGLVIDPAEVSLFRAYSAREGVLLLFGLARPHSAAEVPAFVANDEASEMAVLKGPEELAFPLHTLAVREYFSSRERGGLAP